MSLELGLSGKTALITGGSAGIGKATAQKLAAEGVKVAICGRGEDALHAAAEEIRAATGGNVEAIQADVRDTDSIARLIQTTRERLGPISILVNNAGTSAAAPFAKVPDETWENDIDLKLMAAIRCSRLAVEDMRSAGWGRIVNITAISGKTPGAGSLPTSVSRSAGIALTKAMSKDLAPAGITVNTVCIGLVRSAQIDRMTSAAFPGLDLDAAYAERGKIVPVGRVAGADEAADLIAFLVSERAGYITGTAINFDGGAGATV